jgi:tetratricopeptide (TPR) repeat protein
MVSLERRDREAPGRGAPRTRTAAWRSRRWESHRAAIADYDAALSVNPRYADALANRGGSRADLGELDAALADLEEAIRIDPARATYRFNLGLVLATWGAGTRRSRR